MAVALSAGACGTSVGIITEDSKSPTTATTFAAVTTTTSPTTTTTILEVVLDSELEAQLDELEQQWTSKCEATTNRHAKRIVGMVREWDPTQSQGFGDFGGDMSLLRGDLTLDRSCPVAGYAVRLLVLVDEATPAGEPRGRSFR